MARKLFRRKSSRARSFKRARTSSSNSSGNSVTNRLTTAGYGFAYGSVRNSIHTRLLSQLPTNWNLKEEAAAGLFGFLIGGSKNKWIRKAGDTILTVESASVGHQTVNPMIENTLGNFSTQSNNSDYDY